jgi:hypothetical protein
VTRALLGLDEVGARHLLARLLLDSDEGCALLDAAPRLIRVLKNQQGTVVRAEASIRGPVLWNATIAHRAASGFADDLYVCAMAVRDYDLAENRALAAALRALAMAGRALDGVPASAGDSRQLELRAGARRAAALAAHPRLRGVATRRPPPRELAKVRAGTARVAYGPALALLERVSRGPQLDELLPCLDRANAEHHELLQLVVRHVERTGQLVEPFRTWRGQLFSGHLRYLPPRPGGRPGTSGVALGDLVLVLPGAVDPQDPAAATTSAGPRGRPVVLATGSEVVGATVTEALERLAARRRPPERNRAAARQQDPAVPNS